jgi:hypothetical protein
MTDKLTENPTDKSVDSIDWLAFENWNNEPDSLLYGLRLGEKAKITVLDRMTGWGGGIRDVETGYTDEQGKFWLASGNFDIRKKNVKTLQEAIELIKGNANTCIPS